MGIHAARAQPLPRTCVAGNSGDRVVARLVSELTSSGFTVTTLGSASAMRAPFDEDCDAIARVVPHVAIEVWSVDHGDRTAAEIEAFPLAATPDDPSGAVATVRAAELIRARWLPPGLVVDSAPPTSTVSAASLAPPEVTAPAPSREVELARTTSAASVSVRPNGVSKSTAPHVGLDVGAIVLADPGGVPASTSLVVMPRWIPAQRFAVHATVSVPLTSPEVNASEGHANVTERLIGAAIDVSLLPSAWEWGLNVGAGAAACEVRTQGNARPPYISSTGNAWTSVPFVEAGASRSLWSPRVRLQLLALLGVAWPEIRIRFSGQDVASWGRPLVGAALSVQVDAF